VVDSVPIIPIQIPELHRFGQMLRRNVRGVVDWIIFVHWLASLRPTIDIEA
jgi:hypothetical protein